MPTTLPDIKAFVAVAETGSISRAARRLNLTQPATTRRIQNFETTIGGAPLFDRTVKPAVITAFGQLVLDHCRAVLATVAELETCGSAQANPVGTMKIGLANGFGDLLLNAPFDVLHRRFPDLQLQVRSDWSGNLIELVRAGALDCAIGLFTDEHMIPASIRRRALGSEEIVVVSARRPTLAPDGLPWRLRDLSAEAWVVSPPGCGCRAALQRALDLQQLPMRIAGEVLGDGLQLSLLARSGNLGLVPRSQWAESPHRGRINVLALRDFAVNGTLGMIQPALASRFEAAIEVLAEEVSRTWSMQDFGHKQDADNAFVS